MPRGLPQICPILTQLRNTKKVTDRARNPQTSLTICSGMICPCPAAPLITGLFMNTSLRSLWHLITLASWPIQQWRSASWLNRSFGLLRQWRQQSWLLRYADALGAGMVGLVYAIAPFVTDNNSIVGILLIACAAFWLLLTLSDDQAVDWPALVTGNAAIAVAADGATDGAAGGATGGVSGDGGSGDRVGGDRATHDRMAKLWSLTTPIHLLVFLYWGISCAATALSPVRREAFSGLTKLTLYVLLFALLARLLRSPSVRRFLIAVYLHVALVVSVYGLQQWFSGAAALATWVDPASPLSKTTRVYSYLGNPNLLAGYLLPAVLLSIAAFFAWQSRVRKALALTMVGVNGAAFVLTFSRGGWIGLVVAGFALLLLLVHWWSVALPEHLRRWALPVILGGAAAVMIVAVVAVPTLRTRVLSMFAGREDSSNNFRINVWQSVIQMIKARPVLGIGPGNVAFNKIYPFYQRPRFTALSAYSIILEVAVETGIIGLTCFIWLLVVTIHLGWSQLQRLRSLGSREGYWLIAAIATVFGMLGHGVVDTIWYRPQVNTLWWLMMAIIASYYRPALPGPMQPGPMQPDAPSAEYPLS
jgi:putative inorganic carbon (hco3(-)) transporter